MTIINTTVIIQIILAIFSMIQFIKIKKISGNRLYYHEKKSFQDIYKMNAIYLWPNILFIILLDKVSKIPGVLFIVINMLILVVMMLTIMVAISLYMTTEIKHLSPDDKIGKYIRNLENNSDKRKAGRFYLKATIVGLLVYSTLLIQSIYLHFIIGIFILLVSIFFYYFGMADVLQHEDYNSIEYNAKYKKMNYIEKYFITNLCKFFKNKDYHEKSMSVLHENTSNIKKGVKSIFR